MGSQVEDVFFEIFESLPRQGPGDEASTQRAFEKLSGLPESPEILDLGCGTGAQTLALAKLTHGNITAVDNHAPFLDILKRDAFGAGLGRRIDCIEADMAALDFAGKQFDVIWSEGAANMIGFENALRSWRALLKPNGYLVVSELVWFERDAPQEIRAYFDAVYPDITHYDDIVPVIERAGYELIDRFPLPAESWWTDYYTPAAQTIAGMRRKYAGREDVASLLDAFDVEIDMFRRYSRYYGYAFYIMRTGQ
jgi:SAM-dependent methyltransferase